MKHKSILTSKLLLFPYIIKTTLITTQTHCCSFSCFHAIGPHKLYHIPIWFNPLLLFIIIHLFTSFNFVYSTHMCNVYLVPLILCTIYIVQDKALHTHLQQKPQKSLDGFNLLQLSTHIHLSLYSSFHIKIGPLPLTISFNHTLISKPCAISHATF